MHNEENKALGLGYEAKLDQLRLLTSVNFSKRRGKMRTGLDLKGEEIRDSTLNPLTRRILLSQIAGFYDPIGLASPTKQRGVILSKSLFKKLAETIPQKTPGTLPSRHVLERLPLNSLSSMCILVETDLTGTSQLLEP